MPSTRWGETLSPLSLTIRSFLRSVMTIRPASSKWPTSPVASQPSLLSTRAVSSGLCQYPCITSSPRTMISPSSAMRTSAILHRRPDAVHANARAWAVAADDRPRLGLAVALEEGDPERLEEQADLGIERRAARNHRLHPAAEAGADLLAEGQRQDAVHRQIERVACAPHTSSCRSKARAAADIAKRRRSPRSPSGCARGASRTAAVRRP